MPQARVHCVVHGRVQGVYFRATTQEQARRLRLSGWVRNRRDGTVEILAEGDRTDLQHLIDWCHHGPPAARVVRVEVSWQEASGHFDQFEMR